MTACAENAYHLIVNGLNLKAISHFTEPHRLVGPGATPQTGLLNLDSSLTPEPETDHFSAAVP